MLSVSLKIGGNFEKSTVIQYYENLEKTFFKEQNQPPEVFYNESCSEKFRQIYRKTPLSESLF